MHTPPMQTCAPLQHAPQPHSRVPAVQSATHPPITHAWPHAHGGLHGTGVHVCVVPSQVLPAGQLPGQRPPQPSAAPHATPAGQLGAHTHVPPRQV